MCQLVFTLSISTIHLGSLSGFMALTAQSDFSSVIHNLLSGFNDVQHGCDAAVQKLLPGGSEKNCTYKFDTN